jgi:phosphoenolpyruvate carboxykinase (ATP)
MSNIYNIRTPSEKQASSNCGDYGLDNLGFTNLRKAYWNLPREALYEESIFRGEANISRMGPLIVNTGKYTARAAGDKFVVREATSEGKIWWGQYNRPFEAENFNALFARMQGYFQGRDVFIQDCFGGADPDYRLPIRIITEYAWHSLFVRNMFIKPQTAEEYRRHVPEFTIICAPEFKASPQIDQTVSETFIVLDFAKKMCVIGNTAYGGEIKKSIFTLLNYLLPLQDVMTMHCSANVGKQGDVALFFGLSGTGKTTLSADPNRSLIGDDEHGWSDNGVFNVIELSPNAEPQIHACTRRFGTILENVIWDPVTRAIDLDDASLTENTRASYPLDFIENAVSDKRGGHPKNVIFLTCDASGVLPPIARLNVEQAMYQFISGYTSKVAGTEIGLRDEPEITFSACYGGPFMVHRPAFYAELLRRKIVRYNVKCWLVNTGWVGGPYGVGKRISIKHTRNLLDAVLNNTLDDVEYYRDPVFGFQVPKTCPEVPTDVLYPAHSWQNEDEYWNKYHQLASRFVSNMKKFETETPQEVIAAGPRF